MISAMRIIAILLATAGLALLYAAAIHRETPLISIETITPAMNFAHVRVAGTVPKRAYIGKEGDYVSFAVDDGSGQIRGVAYRNVARALIAAGTLPEAGDRVEMRGSLSIAADSAPKLYIKTASHLTLTTPRSKPKS